MSVKDSYLDANEFMTVARSQRSMVVIQNAFKAVMKLIEAHAEAEGRRIPRSHSQVMRYAHEIKVGKEVGALLDMYLTSYRGQDGEKAKEAMGLAERVFVRLSKNVKDKL